ncbi:MULTISPECIES: class I SAM-dependent methyltransferase [unclassified Bradyrhizobium]|uniref:class I SAM-dependent methyltransferase n=1 Tax=Bradyrhizobium TaxID=374 RepID=UPI0024E145AA|nr:MULTISPECIES: class I SAM-dependent methyltransferase [unclassified Bradyrhizobium]
MYASDRRLALPELERASNAGHLSNHYAIAETEYNSAIRDAQIGRSSRVLDAGCGGGDLLARIATQVGPSGRISAIDISAQAINALNGRLAREPLITPVEARVGSVTRIPFAESVFDHVWCANVVQYLLEDEFNVCIDEFRRVLKPGGRIAIKEVDVRETTLAPLDRGLLLRLQLARIERGNQSKRLGPWCGGSLADRLTRHDVNVLKRVKYTVKHRFPLAHQARHYVSELLRYYCSIAQYYELPSRDIRTWAALAADPPSLLDMPSFVFRETFYLVVARSNKADKSP